MPTLPLTAEAQLYRAWVDSGLTLAELLGKSGLEMSEVSLSRKLRGKQVLNTDECSALAAVLKMTVRLGRRGKAA